MGYALLDHPNPHGPHYYTSRRNPLLAYTVHITAGLQDLDATADQSAEGVVRYAQAVDRDVSWHVSTDTDSTIELLPPGYTAWHASAYNSSTYGHEISKLTVDWSTAAVSAVWVDRTLRQAARHAARIAAQYDIPIRHATRAELDREIAKGAAGKPIGFIGHAPLDPSRRQDPGGWPVDRFPWDRFLQLVREYTAGASVNTSSSEDNDNMGVIERSLPRGTEQRVTINVPPVQTSALIPADGAAWFSIVAGFGELTVHDLWFVVGGDTGPDWARSQHIAGYVHRRDARGGWRLPRGTTHVSLWYSTQPGSEAQASALVEWLRDYTN